MGAVLSFRSYTKYSPLQVELYTNTSLPHTNLLAVLSIGHRSIIAEEKLSVEQLNANNGKNELQGKAKKFTFFTCSPIVKLQNLSN